jgi:hypothetical protein
MYVAHVQVNNAHAIIEQLMGTPVYTSLPVGVGQSGSGTTIGLITGRKGVDSITPSICVCMCVCMCVCARMHACVIKRHVMKNRYFIGKC